MGIKKGDRVEVTRLCVNDADNGLNVGMRGTVVKAEGRSDGARDDLFIVLFDGVHPREFQSNVCEGGAIRMFRDQLRVVYEVGDNVTRAIAAYHEATRSLERATEAHKLALQACDAARFEVDRAQAAMLKAIDGELVAKAEG
jgi:hypothetical protein